MCVKYRDTKEEAAMTGAMPPSGQGVSHTNPGMQAPHYFVYVCVRMNVTYLYPNTHTHRNTHGYLLQVLLLPLATVYGLSWQ